MKSKWEDFALSMSASASILVVNIEKTPAMGTRVNVRICFLVRVERGVAGGPFDVVEAGVNRLCWEVIDKYFQERDAQSFPVP